MQLTGKARAIRFTDAELMRVQEAANVTGTTRHAFMREGVLARARRVLAQQGRRKRGAVSELPAEAASR